MSWSDKLAVLLKNFDLKSKYGGGDGESCKPFFIDGQQVGLVRPDIWANLQSYSSFLKYDSQSDRIDMNPEWESYEERSLKFPQMLQEIRDRVDVFPTLAGWRDECYEVGSKFGDKPLMRMERSATCLFGIKRCGVHINGYITHPDGSKSLWIQKRAANKQTFPSKLDNMVSGGFTVGMTVWECVKKEAQEEASIPESLLESLIPSGTASFIFEDERGIFPETLFVYDIELPVDFQPHNADGEVESFHLLSIDEVKRVLVTGDYKLTSTLVALDFFVRHGFINADNEPNYIQLIETYHAPLNNLYNKKQ